MSKKIVLFIGIALCFFMAGRSIADFIGGFFPPADRGECLKLNVDGVPVKVIVLINDKITHSSIIFVMKNGKLATVSYKELRQMDAEKVACQ